METVTLDDIAQRVAEYLGLDAEGASIVPSDRRTIDNAAGDIAASLKQDGVISYSLDTFPRYLLIPFARLVAAEAADGCNVVNPQEAMAKAAGQEAEIRRLEFGRDQRGTCDASVYL